MSKIKSNNSHLELSFRKALWARGARYRVSPRKYYGKPDIVNTKKNIVVFLDSCFWHFCPLHCRVPISNQDYWIPKLEKNKRRDEEVTSYYIDRHWILLRFWEHDLKSDFVDCVEKTLVYFKNGI